MTTYHTAHLTPDPARNVVWATVARHLAPTCHRMQPSSSSARATATGSTTCVRRDGSRSTSGRSTRVRRARCGDGRARRVGRSSIAGFFVVRRRAGLEFPGALLARRRGVGGGRRQDAAPARRPPRHRPAEFPVRGGITSTITRTGRFSRTCLCRRCCARRAFASWRSGRSFAYSMQGARVPITRFLVSVYLRSPIKPMAGQMLVVAARD